MTPLFDDGDTNGRRATASPADGAGSASPVRSRFGGWAAWLLPFAIVLLVLGWETDWGRRLADLSLTQPDPTPQPVQVALLPAFTLEGAPDSRRETVDRTLFNPTRRPAPPPAQEAAKTRMQRGQFVLTGTAVSGATTIAFLREANGGKSRTARPNDVINGLTVAEVRPDRVRLTLGEESEELILKVAASQKPPPPTVQAASAAAQAAPGGVPPTQAAAAAAPAATAATTSAAAVDERRRQFQQEVAAQQAATATAQAAAVAAPAPPPAELTDPRWAETFQRYGRRTQQNPRTK